MAIEKGIQRILVLEDDFKLVNNFNEKLEEVLKHAPNDANILYLGISNLNRKFGAFQSIDNKFWQRPLGIVSEDYINRTFKSVKGSIFGCYGFIIDNHGMNQYLDFTRIMTYPADVVLGHLSTKHNRINSYSLIKEDLIKYHRMGTTIHYI
jgi:GR25 family glycosyltransferase involved in LPS biosynthesis